MLMYTFIVFVVAPLMIATGPVMSPAVVGRYPWYPKLFGGRQAARSIHFIGMEIFVVFIVMHVALVFVVHPAAIADDRPGMDVAVFREVGEGWRWIKNADPAQGREIGNIRFEGNTAYYSTCSDDWIGYRCLDGARYRDLDLGR